MIASMLQLQHDYILFELQSTSFQNTYNMTLQYCKYIMDELFLARKEIGQCNVHVIYKERVLYGHSLLLGTVSMLIRERVSTAAAQTLIIPIPQPEGFACYECTSKLLDALYARNVQEIEPGHESHAENLINFFKIANIVKEFLYNSFLSRIPKDKRKCGDIKIASNSINGSNDKASLIHKIAPKKTLKIKSPNKTLSAKMQVCIECAFQCYKPADMLAHVIKTKHGRNVCSLCSAHAESHKQFEEHLRKHDHEKPFFCTTCDARFQTRALWTQHLPTHSSLAPFLCPHCSKAFKWKHGLNGHLITHTKEKKHLCDECGFSTTHAKTLRAHKLTHSGEMFRCTHAGCAHTSSRKENMKIHLQTHSKEKPFVCEICGLNFTQNKNLHRHSLIHLQGKVNKVHSCMHCSFKAIRSDNLKAHMIRQHTEKPLNLELCDNFADALSVSDEQCSEETSKNVNSENKSDLTVLADAASGCSRIDEAVVAEEVVCEPTSWRNFDNLIANPTVVDDGQDVAVSLQLLVYRSSFES